jgi:hypothetical protein
MSSQPSDTQSIRVSADLIAAVRVASAYSGSSSVRAFVDKAIIDALSRFEQDSEMRLPGEWDRSKAA